MSQDDSAFLKELQESCLKEVEDYLNEFREILSTFKDDYLNKIELLQKVIHSMKGNLQAVAFLNFGNFVHQLESILESKSQEMTPSEGKHIPEFDLLVCEFLISSVLEAMVSYHAELKNVGVDSEGLAIVRTEVLTALSKWVPKFETESAPMFTPPVLSGTDQPDIDNIISIAEAVENKKLQVPNISVNQTNSSLENDLIDPSIANLDLIQELTQQMNESASVLKSNEPIELKTNSELTVSVPEVMTVKSVPTISNEIKNNLNDSMTPDSQEENSYKGSGLYLLFQNHKKYFAIAIEHIVEVIKSQPLSAPPHRRKNLTGLLNLRGEVLPIINVEEIVTVSEQKPTYVVVSQVNDMRFGFQVETVHQVVTLDQKSFQTVPGIANESDGMVTHFCQTEDKTISILELSELVAA